jgi:hypothetical protein
MRKIALAGMAGLLIAGCGSGPDKSREDAADTRDVDKGPPHVIAFNNRYPNVETKCDHGNRVYVVTQGTYRFFVVPHDPSCGGRQ